jgi:hypothetical protein
MGRWCLLHVLHRRLEWHACAGTGDATSSAVSAGEVAMHVIPAPPKALVEVLLHG